MELLTQYSGQILQTAVVIIAVVVVTVGVIELARRLIGGDEDD